jgi:hypothetical protein
VLSASAAYDGDSSRTGAARHLAAGFLTEVQAVHGPPVSAAPSTCTPLLPRQVTQILDRRPFLVVYLDGVTYCGSSGLPAATRARTRSIGPGSRPRSRSAGWC